MQSIESVENDFRKYAGWTYSPQGHNYQLSYACEAAKQSPGALFLNRDDTWYVFRVKSKIDQSIAHLVHFVQGVGFYFFGHRIGLQTVQSHLSKVLLDRKYFYQSSDPSPGLAQYVCARLCDYNYRRLRQSNTPQGSTVVALVPCAGKDKAQTTLIYPSNLIRQGSVIYEGSMTQEDVHQIEAQFEKLQQTMAHASPQCIERVAQNLKAYDLYVIKPLEKSIAKITQ